MTPRRTPTAPDTLVSLDHAAAAPLYRQLYDSIRDAALSGRLAPGARLPSSRLLARELGVSRNTVGLAFAQLEAEGYLEGRLRGGTFVAGSLPDALLNAGRSSGHGARRGSSGMNLQAVPAPGLSARGTGMLQAAGPPRPARADAVRAFRAGLPAVDHFPRKLWSRLVSRSWRDDGSPLGYGDPAGHPPLRAAIAGYVSAARGARCSPDQVIVVGGSQQGIDLLARVLLDPGDPVWIEDPGYLGARGALLAAGARLVPVPLDHDGLSVAEGERRAASARMAYVTPSHQYPTGVTMSATRRMELLAWAARTGAWIVEDDYDSEFRYASRPLAALQGMDGEDRVIYLGTFSKTLAPALRLGYLVVPVALTDAFRAARFVTARHAPTVEQAALAEFIAEGHFARHVRRMRTLYAERQEALVEAARMELGGLLEVAPAGAGMHLVGWLRHGVSDEAASAGALAAGVEAAPLSRYAIEPVPRGGLLLGYAAFEPAAIRKGVERLANALNRH